MFPSFEEFSFPKLVKGLQQFWLSHPQLETAIFDILQQILWPPMDRIISQHKEQTSTEAIRSFWFAAIKAVLFDIFTKYHVDLNIR